MLKNKIEQLFSSQFNKIVYSIVILSIVGIFTSLIAGFMSVNKPILTIDFFLKVVLQTIMWISIGYSLFYLMITLNSWLKHSIVFGVDLRDARRKMKIANIETKTGNFVATGKIIVCLCAVVSFFLLYLFMVLELFFVVGLAAVVLFWVNMRVTQPPAILFLSSSKSFFVMFNHNDFQKFVRPLRTISLLEYGASQTLENRIIGKIYSELKLDLYRTEFDDDWKDTLDVLLEMTKIVIIDTDAVTPDLLYEGKQIVKNKIIFKCIFLKNEYGNCPLLERLKDENVTVGNDACILSFKESFEVVHNVFYEYNIPTPDRSLKSIKRKIRGNKAKNFKSLTAEESNKHAISCLRTRKFEEAGKYFLKALNSTVEMNEAIWTNLSIVSINMGEFDEALYRVDKALEIKSNHPNALYTKGLALENKGDTNKALKYYHAFTEKASAQNDYQIRDAYARMRKLRSYLAK